MKRLSRREYMTLIQGAETLSSDDYGDKVLRLEDGSILKMFRIKRMFSSARLYPYERRFTDNAMELARKGLPSVRVTAGFKIPSIKRTAVQYVELKGAVLRDYLEKEALTSDLAEGIARFMASLHERGVCFRSIHFGNIVLLKDRNLGLIDIADMKIHRGALSLRARLRNFSHMLRHEEDRVLLRPEAEAFIGTYMGRCGLEGRDRLRLEEGLSGLLGRSALDE